MEFHCVVVFQRKFGLVSDCQSVMLTLHIKEGVPCGVLEACVFVFCVFTRFILKEFTSYKILLDCQKAEPPVG